MPKRSRWERWQGLRSFEPAVREAVVAERAGARRIGDVRRRRAGFLFVDVLEHAVEIIEDAVEGYKDGESSFAYAAWLTSLLAVNFTLGGAGLGIFEQRVRPRRQRPPIAGGASDAITVDEFARAGAARLASRAWALRTGMTVAAAIGLHKFAEGLAIGVSAKAGEVGLATVLIVGFALHNATEGFGIVGPLSDVRPS